MKKTILMLCASMFILNAVMAAVGPQSINFTFNATDSEGWTVSHKSTYNVSDGLLKVTQMGVQNAEQRKYRADVGFTSETFTFDHSKDVVWAIKLTAAVPGTGTAKKFRIKYENTSGGYTESNQFNATQLDCADGVIYYADISSLSDVKTEQAKIGYVTFIFADGVFDNASEAHYSVDWIATFASVNDLKSFKDWKDEQTDLTKPYHELCFRPNAEGNGYTTRRNGFKDVGFEGNYNARFFAVEYFLVENFKPEKVYSLKLTTTGSGGTYPMSVWDFPYQVNYDISAEDIVTRATAVVGYAPGSTGEMNEPITTSSCVNSVWTFVVPGYKLTPLTTIGNKTLVGIFVTSAEHVDGKKGFFASSANTEFAVPSFTQTGINPVVNTTQNKVETTLADAVANANEGDVITIYGDVTISGNRLEIKKELTIQGATGAEKIICGVPANTIMVLANGDEADYTVTFKNLIVDGQNKVRATQTFDSNKKAKIHFDGVSVINTTYSVGTGDVKCAGSNIILTGNNSFPTGIYLNMDKRVDHQGATHTAPVKLILADDYKEDWAIVLNCDKPELYETVDADGVVGWELYKSGTKKELKAKKYCYNLVVSPKAGMATLVLGFDAELPVGVKAYTLTNDGTVNIYATEVERIEANQPVLIIAEPATYTFNREAGVANNEQSTPTNGCLIGTYKQINVPEGGVEKYNYVLANPDSGDGIGFYKVKGTEIKIAKNRAYLSCTYDTQANEANNAPLRIKFGGQMATEIETIDANSQAEKILKEGVLYIRKAGKIYRVDGQLVE